MKFFRKILISGKFVPQSVVFQDVLRHFVYFFIFSGFILIWFHAWIWYHDRLSNANKYSIVILMSKKNTQKKTPKKNKVYLYFTITCSWTMLLISTVISVYGCECDWLLIDNKCFHVSPTTYTWSDARSYCQSSSSDLIVMETSTKNDVLEQFLPAFDLSIGLWVGARDVGTEGDWKWIGDIDIDYSGRWISNSHCYPNSTPHVLNKSDQIRSNLITRCPSVIKKRILLQKQFHRIKVDRLPWRDSISTINDYFSDTPPAGGESSFLKTCLWFHQDSLNIMCNRKKLNSPPSNFQFKVGMEKKTIYCWYFF